MKPQHTPTPYYTVPCKCGNPKCDKYYLKGPLQIDGRLDKEDAIFIVRACNAHDELLSAAKDYLSWLESDFVGTNKKDLSGGQIKWLKQIIAKGEI